MTQINAIYDTEMLLVLFGFDLIRWITGGDEVKEHTVQMIFRADDIPQVKFSCSGKRIALAASPNQTWPGDTVMPVIRPDLRIFNLSLSDGSGVQRRNQGERLLRHR